MSRAWEMTNFKTKKNHHKSKFKTNIINSRTYLTELIWITINLLNLTQRQGNMTTAKNLISVRIIKSQGVDVIH